MLPKLPKEALNLLAAIEHNGGLGYVVGGAVRDLLLGRQPKDWDFASSLAPAQVMEIFPGARPVGGVYGTVSVPFGEGYCEITPFRTEGAYSDKRHPDAVVFVGDVLQDLSRRDFTVNAMACDGRMLLDPFDGQGDLERKILRCVGEPRERFAEDPLRILRLFRLAGQLGFTAEWDTFSAANDAMEDVALLPRQRVGDEVRRMLMSDGPQVLGGIIAKGGLRAYGFGFAPELAVLARVPKTQLCRWWALIMLCGAQIERVATAFGFSQKFTARLEECGRLYRMGPSMDAVGLKHKMSRTDMDYGPLAQTFASVSPVFSAEPAWFLSITLKNEPYRLAHLAVDGELLRIEGIRGEACGRILNELLAAVIKNPSLNRVEVLLGLAKGLKQLL